MGPKKGPLNDRFTGKSENINKKSQPKTLSRKDFYDFRQNKLSFSQKSA